MPAARHARNVKELALPYMYMYLPCECHNTAAITCTCTVQSSCALLHGCRKNATKRTTTDKVCIADAWPHLRQSCKSARPSGDSTIDVKQALDDNFLKIHVLILFYISTRGNCTNIILMTQLVNVHTYPWLKKSVFVTFWGTHVTSLENGFH